MNKLTKSEKTLFRYYYKKTLGDKGVTRFRLSLAQIAEDTRLGRATVQRGNDTLRERGLLDWTSGHLLDYGGENVYTLPEFVVARYRQRMAARILTK